MTVGMEYVTETDHKQKVDIPLNELLVSPIVDIYTGPGSTHWPLHERLLYHHSPYLAKILSNGYDKPGQLVNDSERPSRRGNKSYSFPGEEDHTFSLLVSWLYNQQIPHPKIEKDIGPLLKLYSLAQKLQIDKLATDVMDITHKYYLSTSWCPDLHHVQYIYTNTDGDRGMREILVSSVAKHFATTKRIPIHWASVLQQNRRLAVDIIRRVRRRNSEEKSLPDVHHININCERGGKEKTGFSNFVREVRSSSPEATAAGGSTRLQENSDPGSVRSDDNTSRGDGNLARAFNEDGKDIGTETEFLNLSFLNRLQTQLTRPPDTLSTRTRNPTRRQNQPRRSVAFKSDVATLPAVNEDSDEEYPDDDDDDMLGLMSWPEPMENGMKVMFHKREVAALAVLWVLYLCWIFGVFGGSGDGGGEK